MDIQYPEIAIEVHFFTGDYAHVAYFKATHELNPEMEAGYTANLLGLTCQLYLRIAP